MPQKTRRPRQTGKPRPFWGFRPTAEIEEFVESSVERERTEKSSFIVGCLEVCQSARAELGDEWFEIERQAKVEGVLPGTILGRLARAGVEKGRKR